MVQLLFPLAILSSKKNRRRPYKSAIDDDNEASNRGNSLAILDSSGYNTVFLLQPSDSAAPYDEVGISSIDTDLRNIYLSSTTDNLHNATATTGFLEPWTFSNDKYLPITINSSNFGAEPFRYL